MKAFISFASEDRAQAERLYAQLTAAGASVFQFGRSETAGTDAWEEIITWIRDSDVFITLVSQHARKSKAVATEIKVAHYSHVNRDRPEKLIPAIIEKGVEVPVQIERFSTVDLCAFEEGVKRLLDQLGLKVKAAAAAAVPLSSFAFPDTDRLLAKYQKTHRGPDPVSEWAEGADELINAFNANKPKKLSEAERRASINSLLAGYTAGELPDAPWLSSIKHSNPKFRSLLMRQKEAPFLFAAPLPAPKLEEDHEKVFWDPVPDADGYVLEESRSFTFEDPQVVYRGTDTSYTPDIPKRALSLLRTRWYRVKATGITAADSEWSNSVLFSAPAPATASLGGDKVRYGPSAIYLAAPQVESNGLRISWEPVPGADEYVVEESDNREFGNPREVYRGSNTAYSPFLSTAPEVKKPGLRLMPESAFMKPLSPTPSTSGFGPLTFRVRWLRVKAKCGLFVDSDWSDPVLFSG